MGLRDRIRARRDWRGFWDGLVTQAPEPTMTIARFHAWWAEHHWHLQNAPERVEVEVGDVVTIIYDGDGKRYQTVIVEGGSRERLEEALEEADAFLREHGAR